MPAGFRSKRILKCISNRLKSKYCYPSIFIQCFGFSTFRFRNRATFVTSSLRWIIAHARNACSNHKVGTFPNASGLNKFFLCFKGVRRCL